MSECDYAPQVPPAPAEQDTQPITIDVETSSASIKAPTPVTSAAAKAFDLFDAGKLGEAALLIGPGVSRDGFTLNDDLSLRALTAFEDGRLSEDGLVKVLG